MKLLTGASLSSLLVFFLVFGSGSSWEPSPVAEDAPHQAVLRVVATEEMPFTIEWGSDGWSSTEETEDVVPEGKTYIDYPVPESIVRADGGGFEPIRVSTADGAASWQQEGSLGAILYVEGEYADCSHAASRAVPFSDQFTGIPSVGVGWSGDPQETGGMSKRLTCGLYRWYT